MGLGAEGKDGIPVDIHARLAYNKPCCNPPNGVLFGSLSRPPALLAGRPQRIARHGMRCCMEAIVCTRSSVG